MINKPRNKIYLEIYDAQRNHLENSDSKCKSKAFETLEVAFNCGIIAINGSCICDCFGLQRA